MAGNEMTLQHIENFPNLRKDSVTNAVLNNDEMEYLAFLEKRKLKKEQNDRLEQLEKQVNDVDNKLSLILHLLKR